MLPILLAFALVHLEPPVPIANPVGMTFVAIPHPPSPFFMQTTEVTRSQWKAVMGTMPWGETTGVADSGDLPATRVAWGDVQAFLSRLNTLDPARTYRLPTVAEWQFAARAGGPPRFDGPLAPVAWFQGSAAARVHPVGRLASNAWGLYDMRGNVWEWCEDAFTGAAGQTHPAGCGCTEHPSSRAIVGGSWKTGEFDVRHTTQMWLRGERTPIDVGFRVLMIPAPHRKP